jgi:hypothetical protein
MLNNFKVSGGFMGKENKTIKSDYVKKFIAKYSGANNSGEKQFDGTLLENIKISAVHLEKLEEELESMKNGIEKHKEDMDHVRQDILDWMIKIKKQVKKEEEKGEKSKKDKKKKGK